MGKLAVKAQESLVPLVGGGTAQGSPLFRRVGASAQRLAGESAQAGHVATFPHGSAFGGDIRTVVRSTHGPLPERF